MEAAQTNDVLYAGELEIRPADGLALAAMVRGGEASPLELLDAAVAGADSVIASKLNLPTVSISKSAGRERADVHAEAVQFVKSHKSAFAVQLDQYKN